MPSNLAHSINSTKQESSLSIPELSCNLENQSQTTINTMLNSYTDNNNMMSDPMPTKGCFALQ